MPSCVLIHKKKLFSYFWDMRLQVWQFFKPGMHNHREHTPPSMASMVLILTSPPGVHDALCYFRPCFSNLWPGQQKSTMLVQITPSYIFIHIFHSEMSIHFLWTSEDSPLNSTLAVLILFNSYKRILSYSVWQSKVEKSRWCLCTHMVDFCRPGHIYRQQYCTTGLTNHTWPISHHITPLVINALGGRHTHTHTHKHTHKHTYQCANKNDFNKPGATYQ